MSTQKNIPLPLMRNLANKYGSIVLVVLMAYFFLMWQLDMVKYISLHYVNYIIIFAGMYYMMKEVRRKDHRNKTDYLPGMGILYMYAAYVALTFGIFSMLVILFNPDFLPLISDSLPYSEKLSPWLACFAVASEMFLFTIILAFATLMLFKRDRVPNATKVPDKNDAHGLSLK